MADSVPSNRRGDLLPAIAIVAGFLLLGVVVYFVYSKNRADAVAWGGNDPAQRAELLREMRERESEQLGSYGWVDEDAGIVRLPIERAMELTVEEINRDRQDEN